MELCDTNCCWRVAFGLTLSELSLAVRLLGCMPKVPIIPDLRTHALACRFRLRVRRPGTMPYIDWHDANCEMAR